MLTGCTEKWPRIIYQNTSYRFDEYNRTIVLDDGHSYDIVETEDGYDLIFHFIVPKEKEKHYRVMYERYAFDPATECDSPLEKNILKHTPSQFKNRNLKSKMVFEIFMAWENEFVKIFTLFPEIHAPVLSHFITLKHYS
jgi:hypothetical protein